MVHPNSCGPLFVSKHMGEIDFTEKVRMNHLTLNAETRQASLCSDLDQSPFYCHLGGVSGLLRVTCHRKHYASNCKVESPKKSCPILLLIQKIDDLKKQEFLIVPRHAKGLGRNTETCTPCFTKYPSSVAFCSPKGPISVNLSYP